MCICEGETVSGKLQDNNSGGGWFKSLRGLFWFPGEGSMMGPFWDSGNSVGTSAYLCKDCGHIQLYGDKPKTSDDN